MLAVDKIKKGACTHCDSEKCSIHCMWNESAMQCVAVAIFHIHVLEAFRVTKASTLYVLSYILWCLAYGPRAYM